MRDDRADALILRHVSRMYEQNIRWVQLECKIVLVNWDTRDTSGCHETDERLCGICFFSIAVVVLVLVLVLVFIFTAVVLVFVLFFVVEWLLLFAWRWTLGRSFGEWRFLRRCLILYVATIL